MMMNWTYNSFATDNYGNARYGWVEGHMAAWIGLAVDNSQ
jgi:hypothetical protein